MPDVTVKGRSLCGEIYCFYGWDNQALCPDGSSFKQLRCPIQFAFFAK